MEIVNDDMNVPSTTSLENNNKMMVQENTQVLSPSTMTKISASTSRRRRLTAFPLPLRCSNKTVAPASEATCEVLSVELLSHTKMPALGNFESIS